MRLSTEQKSYPRIRSFIRRQGRATAGQKLALENNWRKFGLDPEKTYDFAEVFERNAPLIVEIGFGNGNSLAEMAAANPSLNYLGIEVHTPGVGHLMLLLEQHGITNIRVFNHDAIEILEQKIKDDSLLGVHLFFPDPWQKRRHHKRRIVQPDFVDLVYKKLKPGGHFHTATDWEHYAKDMLRTLSSSKLSNSSEHNQFCKKPDYRPLTKFEKRGIKLGHNVWDLIFKKS